MHLVWDCVSRANMSESIQDRRRRALQKLRALSFAPLMRGSLIERLRKCGRRECACATDRSKRHRGKVVWVKVKGRVHSLYIREEDVDSVEKRLKAYNELWEVVEELTECEIAEMKAKIRERRRSRKKGRGDG